MEKIGACQWAVSLRLGLDPSMSLEHKLMLLLCVGKSADDGRADQAQGDDETGQKHKQLLLKRSLTPL